jgi:hypothetical protein
MQCLIQCRQVRMRMVQHACLVLGATIPATIPRRGGNNPPLRATPRGTAASPTPPPPSVAYMSCGWCVRAHTRACCCACVRVRVRVRVCVRVRVW